MNRITTTHTKASTFSLGPAQHSVRVASDGETLTIEAGHDDPFRPAERLALPAEALRMLRQALDDVLP